MNLAHRDSSEALHGDRGLMEMVVWYRKSWGAVPFISFLLKIVSTLGSGLVTIISGGKKRTWPKFMKEIKSVTKLWIYSQYYWQYGVRENGSPSNRDFFFLFNFLKDVSYIHVWTKNKTNKKPPHTPTVVDHTICHGTNAWWNHCRGDIWWFYSAP